MPITYDSILTAMEYVGDANDLNLRQLASLYVVAEKEPVYMRDIASALKICRPSACRAVDALWEHGYVRRIRDDEDRRNVYAMMTIEGKRFLAAIR